MKLEEAKKIAELYIPISEKFYAMVDKEGIDLTEGRHKFRSDFKEALKTLIDLAEAVKVVDGKPCPICGRIMPETWADGSICED